MAYVPNSGSVVSFQSNPSVLQTLAGLMSTNASVITVGTAVANQSVSGTVQTDVRSSVATVIIGGSILTATGNSSVQVLNFPANQSVSGAVSISNLPTTQNVSGSVAAFMGGSWSASVGGTVSVLGTVPVTQSGAWSASLVGTIPGSVVAFQGAGWSGSVAATITNTNVNVSGSVVAFGFPTNQNVSGSVIAFMAGTQSSSTYGMRNDAVASFLGADLTVRPIATDSAGRTLVKPFSAEESRVEGYISLTSTSVTTLVAAAGAGLRNYITDLWAANTGAATTLLTLTSGGGSSVLGYTIVPTGGGTNLQGLQMPIRTEANATFGVQAGTATSTLYVTVKGFKAP